MTIDNENNNINHNNNNDIHDSHNSFSDEAIMSPDGSISITGRVKDMIIRGGENIYPMEIENFLMGMSEVNDKANSVFSNNHIDNNYSSNIIIQRSRRLMCVGYRMNAWARRSVRG